jgi:hypothetical protein
MKHRLARPGWESTQGNKSRCRKIDENAAQAILDAKGSGMSQGAVAERYGATPAIVGAIWRRQSWTHLRAKQ